MSIASRERRERRFEGRNASATKYRADDRDAEEFGTDTKAEMAATLEERATDTFGGNPTVAAVRRMWAERDERYNDMERDALTDKDVEAIVRFRLQEVQALDIDGRTKAALTREVYTEWDIDPRFPL